MDERTGLSWCFCFFFRKNTSSTTRHDDESCRWLVVDDDGRPTAFWSGRFRLAVLLFEFEHLLPLPGQRHVLLIALQECVVVVQHEDSGMMLDKVASKVPGVLGMRRRI